MKPLIITAILPFLLIIGVASCTNLQRDINDYNRIISDYQELLEGYELAVDEMQSIIQEQQTYIEYLEHSCMSPSI